MTIARILCAAALCLATPALAEDACRLTRVATVAMSSDEAGGAYVPMTVAGQTVQLLIDTGSIDSMLTETTVKALGLTTSAMNGHQVMFGGQKIDRYATAHDVDFGGLKARLMKFVVMPDDRMPPELNGILGPDILRAYDDDFDFANARFNLILPDHCPGQVVYWTHDDFSQIPFDIDLFGHIRLSVLLDGKAVTVGLDTGSTRSVMSFELAERLFGIDENSPGIVVLPDRGHGHAYKYPFKTLTFGGVAVSNPDVLLIRDEQSRILAGRAILGMGVLRQLHLYLAYKEHAMYVSAASAH